MSNRKEMWKQIVQRAGFVVLVALLFTACNLGRAAPSEPVEPLPGDEEPPLQPQDLVETLTPTPPIALPPTATPTIVLTPREQIQSVTVEGTEHRTQEPVTIRVRYGASVSNVTCNWVLQDTGQASALGTPTTADIDENTKENTYTFTPEAAGTYAVNCHGIAVTLGGQVAVNAVGTPFAVEAKG